MCSAGKFLTILTPFPIFNVPGKFLCVLQNYLPLGSFLAGRAVNLHWLLLTRLCGYGDYGTIQSRENEENKIIKVFFNDHLDIHKFSFY